MATIATSPLEPSPPAERDAPPAPVPAAGGRRGTLPLFAAASFTGAALLFAVQPMVAKMLLPLLGGSAAVWNTAMVFFQAVLLAGYAFAHRTTSRLSPDRHRLVQVALVSLAVLALPIAVPAGWRPSDDVDPTAWVLLVLMVAVGVPFFVLSTVSPTLQRWFTATDHPSANDPYFLYAAGNAGSLLALVAYPLVLEPRLDLASQSRLWTAGYLLFAVLCGLCALRSRSPARSATAPEVAPAAAAAPPPSGRRCVGWAFLGFVPSALMLGVTRHLSTDIAAVPLLWVVPLALYLLTFVIAFGRDPARLILGAGRALRFLVVPIAISMVGFLPWTITMIGAIVAHVAAFFAAALLAHGRLAADRPDPAHLTRFYLWLSIGGVAGGIFAALVAPLVFDTMLEYPIALVLALVLIPPAAQPWTSSPSRLAAGVGTAGFVLLVVTAAVLRTDGRSLGTLLLGSAGLLAYVASRRPWSFALAMAAVLAVVTVGIDPGVLRSERTFFGVSEVKEDGREHALWSGSTLHGRQRGSAPPLDYYAPGEPMGQFFAAIEGDPPPRRVGVIGLGTGALAHYGRPGDRFDFYEIDPAVVDIATDPELFTYLSASAAEVRTVVGDGRLALRDRPDERYDLLVLDAFSSDAIPMHLLTREAVELYLDRLAPSGVVALHISNRYFDLEPVLARHRLDLGLAGLVQHTPVSSWVVLSRDPSALAQVGTDRRWRELVPGDGVSPWTDTFSDLLSAL